MVATSGSYRGVLFAVKVFRRLSKPERRDNFFKESEFLEKCNHPSIMRVFDSGTFATEYPFLVAEYLPQTLFQVIRAANTSIVLKISYAMQLLSAIAYLESLEEAVVHRDLKPQNIFVKGQSCVIGDFGLMKHVSAEDDEDLEVFKESLGVGMPARYRTPDQVSYLNKQIARITPKSDVFQLGLVLAELFSGKNPQQPANDFGEPIKMKPLSAIPGSLARPIADVIKQMLLFEPAVRKNARELLDAWEGIFTAAVKQAHALEGRAV